MPNPYASQAKSGNASKMKALTGKKSGGAVYAGESAAKPKYARGGSVGEFKVGGTVSPPNFARGGRSKGKGKGKGNTNIKIMVVGGKEKEGPEGMPPMLPPRPPMAPPPGMGPPGGPPGGIPGAPPMKRGGKVPMKAGAETGQGRMEKAKAYGMSPKKAG